MKTVMYYVMTATRQAVYTTDTPEQAVHAFHHEFPEASSTVRVFVLDDIGEFKRETVITRIRPTHPDSPNAKARAQPTP